MNGFDFERRRRIVKCCLRQGGQFAGLRGEERARPKLRLDALGADVQAGTPLRPELN